MSNLAYLYQNQGAYERAEPLCLRALQIQEAVLGKNHPDVATSLSNLAGLYQAQGAYERAEPLYQRALQIQEAVLGKNHPGVATSLSNLGSLYKVQDRLSAAWPLFERSFAISEQRIRREAPGFSESRLASLLRLLWDDDITLYNLLREHPSEAAARRLALTAALLHKGRSAGEIADTSRAIYRNLGEADRQTFQRLRTLRAQLATLSLDGPGKISSSDYQARLGQLAVEGDTLEAELARRSAVLRAQEQLPGPSDVIPRVAAVLPSDGALIEIVSFWAHPLVLPPGTAPSQMKFTLTYFALILLPQGDIRVADLGPAEAIHRAARRLHKIIDQP